jgi:hypothetical protein
MTRTMAAAAVALGTVAWPGRIAAQAGKAAEAARPAARDSGAVGAYEFAFVPANGEPVTGRLVVSRQSGRYRGVVTSPKLSEPLDADSVRVTGAHVFASMLDGAYTFAFDVRGAEIADAVFTKTMRGATEQGPLLIRRVVR